MEIGTKGGWVKTDNCCKWLFTAILFTDEDSLQHLE